MVVLIGGELFQSAFCVGKKGSSCEESKKNKREPLPHRVSCAGVSINRTSASLPAVIERVTFTPFSRTWRQKCLWSMTPVMFRGLFGFYGNVKNGKLMWLFGYV